MRIVVAGGTGRVGARVVDRLRADGHEAVPLARVATGEPLRGVVDLAGPERVRFDAFLRGVLATRGDDRDVVTDPLARYFGALLGEGSLVPRGDALRGRTPWARFAAPRTRNLPAGS